MDWLEHLNRSLVYLEEHLTGEISIEKAATLAHCSAYHYQRMFSYIADVTLGEYIRRRRMSLAGVDLKNGKKVIDVALKYGYDSPTAFNRAFKSIHGVTPSEARNPATVLTSYPLLHFAIQIKGVNAMEYQIVEKESFTVVGKSLKMGKNMEENQQRIPQFWNEQTQHGLLEKLFPLMGDKVPGLLGVCLMDGPVADEWDYVIGVATDIETGDFEVFEVPTAKWAIFSGEGSMPHAMQELQKRIYSEWLPTSGYEYAELPDIEVYLNADMANAKFQVWLPVRNKKQD